MPWHRITVRHTRTWSRRIVIDAPTLRHAEREAQRLLPHLDPGDFEEETGPNIAVSVVELVDHLLGEISLLDEEQREQVRSYLDTGKCA